MQLNTIPRSKKRKKHPKSRSKPYPTNIQRDAYISLAEPPVINEYMCLQQGSIKPWKVKSAKSKLNKGFILSNKQYYLGK